MIVFFLVSSISFCAVHVVDGDPLIARSRQEFPDAPPVAAAMVEFAARPRMPIFSGGLSDSENELFMKLLFCYCIARSHRLPFF